MRIQVIGAGSWGLALARLLARNGADVRLWCREEDGPAVLRDTRQSPHYLPGIALPDSIDVDAEIDPDADIALLAVPSHVVRAAISMHRFSKRTIRLSVAKGIENETLLRMSEVIRATSGEVPIAVLSGPSHAEEVARDLPASVVVAGDIPEVCAVVQRAFMTESFRVYTTGDLVGVELGGALKNVIAVAAGICDGFSLGDNARAALITRGLAEITRLGAAMGADPLTFAGLSGMGDLIVTCDSAHSRNRALGVAIAAGVSLDDALRASKMVAEGVRTTRAAWALAHRRRVEMPITEQVHAVLFEGADPRASVQHLMLRGPKPERG